MESRLYSINESTTKGWLRATSTHFLMLALEMEAVIVAKPLNLRFFFFPSPSLPFADLETLVCVVYVVSLHLVTSISSVLTSPMLASRT